MRGLERRQQSEENTRNRAYSERERENPPVKIEVNPIGHFIRKRAHHQVHAPDGQEQTERAAHQAEDNAFGQELPHDLAPACAQGEANADLLGPGRAPRQEEIRDVGAGDEMHEKNRAHDEEREGLEVREPSLRGTASRARRFRCSSPDVAAIRAVIASSSARACSIETPFFTLPMQSRKKFAARMNLSHPSATASRCRKLRGSASPWA